LTASHDSTWRAVGSSAEIRTLGCTEISGPGAGVLAVVAPSQSSASGGKSSDDRGPDTATSR
jgi:hypothetical protein